MYPAPFVTEGGSGDVKSGGVKLKTISKTSTIEIHAQHPDVFYLNVPASVSVTLGRPLFVAPHILNFTDTIPKAFYYTVQLQGVPPTDFDITPSQQEVAIPSHGLESSTIYFTVIPHSLGNKRIDYMVKAHWNLQGIGLPVLHKDIVVKVSGESLKVEGKKIARESSTKLLAAGVTAGLTALGAWFWKRWKKPKRKVQKD
jgi:hypothetical protein